jgi:hypothetical protein
MPSTVLLPRFGFAAGDRNAASIDDLRRLVAETREVVFQGETMQCYLLIEKVGGED